jgi:integrase
MVEYKQNQPSTAQRRIAQLRFMERHSVFPVQLNKGAFQLVQSFWLYIQHRKKVEECNVGALRNDHKAVRALGDFLAIPEAAWPTAPTEPMTDERFIPPPELVHQLLHADYTPNPSTSYANALVKGFLAFDFLIGARCPSEAFSLKLTDFSAERHRIVITEPKKSGRRRTLGLDPDWICCSTRRPSLANYTRYWRVKVDTDLKQTAFFLKPDGKPFGSKAGLRKFVCELVQPKFPWFHPYLGRHWSANARLIDWDFDYNRVADWHGHESVNMTRKHYEHNARLLKQEHGGDWLARAGRARRKTD